MYRHLCLLGISLTPVSLWETVHSCGVLYCKCYCWHSPPSMKNKVAFVELIQTAAIMIAFWYGYSRKNVPKGGLHHFSRNLHFFVPVITFFPFFYANNYCTSLLLIVCALKWYIKSPHRHLFFGRYIQTRKVTHFLICGKDNSKAPWPTRPQIGLRVAKALSCDSDSAVSQLSALATLRPIWGRVGQGAFELSLPQIRKWVT